LAALTFTCLTPIARADDLDAVRARRAELQAQLDDVAATLADLDAHLSLLEDERIALTAELESLNESMDAADTRIVDRVRELYMNGRIDPMLSLLTSAHPDEALRRAAITDRLVRSDRVLTEVAASGRTRTAHVLSLLDARRSELAAASAEQVAALADLDATFRQVAALEASLEEEQRIKLEEEARARAAEEAARLAEEAARLAEEEAAADVVVAERRVAERSGSYACLIASPYSYSDTWGAPRSGGRSHKGTDVLAPRGAHVYAVVNGVVSREGPGSLSGYYIKLYGDDGDLYYYMHLDGFEAADGQRVAAGDLIGYNGDTGNARGTPHVHFEHHPGGGGAINPYPFVRSVCG